MIWSADTAVVYILASYFNMLGIGNFRYGSIQELANSLGVDKSNALPVLRAFTRSFTVSLFAVEVEKQHGFAFNDVTRAFVIIFTYFFIWWILLICNPTTTNFDIICKVCFCADWMLSNVSLLCICLPLCFTAMGFYLWESCLLIIFELWWMVVALPILTMFL